MYNNHYAISTFFTGTYQEFQHVITYFLLKTSRIARILDYDFKVEFITLYDKNNHCIISRFFLGVAPEILNDGTQLDPSIRQVLSSHPPTLSPLS